MRKYAAELVGTMFLTLTIGGAVRLNPIAAPLAIGTVLAAMIYANGHVSGAHLNPAVTLAVHLRGRLAGSQLLPYWASQLLGAALGSTVVCFLIPTATSAPPTLSGHALAAAWLAEFLFTFALAYTVLNVATSDSHPKNGFYGIAIGGVVLAGATAVGPISGGAFNPAVALALSIMGLTSWSNLWMFVTAGLTAGAVASVAFTRLDPTADAGAASS